MIELKNDCLHFTFPELRASLSRLFDAYEEDLLHRVYREDRRKAFESYRKRLGIKPRGFRPEGLDKVLRLGKAELGQAIRLAVAKVRPDRAPGCEIEFQRTLRLPDDGRTRFLPPGLGRFPLRHIDDYGARMPEKWLARGGVMMPMYQSEALWLKFRSVYPCAVKVGAGRIDALTGEEWAEGLRSHPQNYLTLPEQPWLDGFAMAPGVVRQFVATPLGGGSTVEEQITGAAEFGGIQLQAWPMRAATYFERIARPQLPESLADLLPDLLGRRGFHVLEERLSFCDAASVAEPAMGLGMGGLMRQQVYRDKLGPRPGMPSGRAAVSSTSATPYAGASSPARARRSGPSPTRTTRPPGCRGSTTIEPTSPPSRARPSLPACAASKGAGGAATAPSCPRPAPSSRPPRSWVPGRCGNGRRLRGVEGRGGGESAGNPVCCAEVLSSADARAVAVALRCGGGHAAGIGPGSLLPPCRWPAKSLDQSGGPDTLANCRPGRPEAASPMEEASATPLLPMHCPECGKTVDVSGLPPYSKIECPHCAALIRVRSTMGQYEIVGVLGEGGMSQVFRAVDRTLGREVALKILHQSLSRDAALTAMFEREAKLTASIVHPNVVKVFSVGQDQGYFYIAMELLRATSLELLIANKGALSESEVLGIALEVARGLKAAYEEKLIHRDIKPGNMLVTGEGTTKLVDFGLALQQGGEDISEDLWATPFYVPPEKLDGASDTFLGDIYSLGATIYHALAGKPPFDANTPSLEELKEIKRQPVDLKAVAPGLSKPTVKLVERMMAYRPEDRVQSYDELIEAVEEVRRRQFGIVASGRARTKPGRVRLLAAVGGGVAALVLVILILAGRDDPGDPGDLGIGNGERVITVGDSTVSGQFQGARELLAEGKRRDAGAGFESLAANESAPASTRIWSHFLLGTIRLFEGETSLAEESFEAVGKLPPESDAASAASIEFLQRAAGPLAEPLPVLGEDAAFASDSVEVLGLLAAGLKNWQAGAFESGAELLRAFAESSPPEAYPWIEPIKRQVRPFLADLELIRGLPNPGDPGAADDQGGLAEQGEALKEVAAKLRTRGAAPGLVARRLERLAEIGKLAAAAKPAGTAAPQATATPPPVTPTTGTPTTGTPTTGTPTTGTPTTGTPTTGTPGTPVPSPTEAAEIAQLKALVEENRPLAESLLFSGIAIKLKEVAPETLLGASVREALALACADAPRFPAELARALAVRPWRGSVRRRAGRPLDATVSAKDEETFVVDLGFGPNEVELGEFALDWLVEAGLDSLAPVGEGGIGPWRSLLAFAALSGQVGMLEGKAAELAEADGEFARSWAALKHLR